MVLSQIPFSALILWFIHIHIWFLHAPIFTWYLHNDDFSIFIILSTFISCNFFVSENYPFLPPIYLFIYLYNYGLTTFILFYGLWPIAMIISVFAQIGLDLTIGNSFKSALMSFWHPFIIFWALLYFLALQDVPGYLVFYLLLSWNQPLLSGNLSSFFVEC